MTWLAFCTALRWLEPPPACAWSPGLDSAAMMRRWSLVLLAVAPPLILLCFLLPGSHLGAWFPLAWAQLLSAVLVLLLPVAMCVLGAARDGELGPLRMPLWTLAVLLQLSMLAMVWLSGRPDVTVAGLPAAMVVMLLGLGLGPLLLTCWAYAAAFDGFTLTEDDLRRLRTLTPEQER